jgi:hypothetical protein
MDVQQRQEHHVVGCIEASHAEQVCIAKWQLNRRQKLHQVAPAKQQQCFAMLLPNPTNLIHPDHPSSWCH